MSKFGDRLIEARKALNITSQAAAGRLVGMTGSAFGKIERGETTKPNNWEIIAEKFMIPKDEAQRLIDADAVDAGKDSKVTTGTLSKLPPLKPSEKLFRWADIRRRNDHPGTIPVLGSAAAGEPGRLIMLNEVIGYIPTPPELDGVDGGYAVYVHGTSMEPRYFPGEKVYVHPYKPVAKGNFCLVQVGEDPSNPEGGYIKQFVSWEDGILTLSQYNPKEEIHFPDSQVISVHRIVGNGE